METYVRLLCRDCGKHWEEFPGDLPAPARPFTCPDCHANRPLSEFARTEHDLRSLQEF